MLGIFALFFFIFRISLHFKLWQCNVCVMSALIIFSFFYTTCYFIWSKEIELNGVWFYSKVARTMNRDENGVFGWMICYNGNFILIKTLIRQEICTMTVENLACTIVTLWFHIIHYSFSIVLYVAYAKYHFIRICPLV